MRRLLIALSGARTDLLDRTPRDRATYENVGASILIAAAFAGVSMTFALRTALNALLPIAVLLGALWAAGIMCLDHWLVMKIQRRVRRWRNLCVAAPCVGLALVTGAVIGTSLVLQIFRPEIEAQLAVIRVHDAAGAENHGPAGMIMRLKAFDQISAEYHTFNYARLLLLLFVTTVECLPVLVKLLHTLGPVSTYERLLAKAEEAEVANVWTGKTTNTVVIVRLSDWLVSLMTRLLPRPYRARYAEEFRGELLDLAAAGASRWDQIRYALRQLTRAGHTYVALRAPFRRKASP